LGELAHLCGLRADEVAGFPSAAVVDPSLTNQTLFYVQITGKFNKQRSIMVSRLLMNSLWTYLNSAERQHRLSKWQLENGEISEAPLFLNRSGKPIQAKSVGNIISNVRDELGDKCLKRSFHDLRSTFATNLASFMLKKNLPIGFIQYKLCVCWGIRIFLPRRNTSTSPVQRLLINKWRVGLISYLVII